MCSPDTVTILGNIVTEISHSPDVTQVAVGCEEDDSFYSDSDKSGRVMILIETPNSYSTLDLEDVLIFARKYCNGVYERVLSEVSPEIVTG